MNDRMSQSRNGHNLLRRLEQTTCGNTQEARKLLEGEEVLKPIMISTGDAMRWVLFRLAEYTRSLECPGATLMREKGRVLLAVSDLRTADQTQQYEWDLGNQKFLSGRGSVVSGICDLGPLEHGNFIVQIREKIDGLRGLMAKRKQQQG